VHKAFETLYGMLIMRNERERRLEPELPIFQGFPNAITPLALCSNDGRLTRSCGWTSCLSKLEMGDNKNWRAKLPRSSLLITKTTSRVSGAAYSAAYAVTVPVRAV
jgi:hypothetical protein